MIDKIDLLMAEELNSELVWLAEQIGIKPYRYASDAQLAGMIFQVMHSVDIDDTGIMEDTMSWEFEKRILVGSVITAQPLWDRDNPLPKESKYQEYHYVGRQQWGYTALNFTAKTQGGVSY